MFIQKLEESFRLPKVVHFGTSIDTMVENRVKKIEINDLIHKIDKTTNKVSTCSTKSEINCCYQLAYDQTDHGGTGYNDFLSFFQKLEPRKYILPLKGNDHCYSIHFFSECDWIVKGFLGKKVCPSNSVRVPAG